MPTKIVYDTLVGTEADLFKLNSTEPSKAMLIADLESSEFLLSNLTHDDPTFATKRIYSIQSTPRKTRVESNTIDLRMSDVKDSNDNPLFYKTRRKLSHLNNVLVDGEEAGFKDGSFIYSNNPEAIIEYKSDQGNLVLQDKPDFYPVFIWEQLAYLQDVMDVDNKKFTFRESKGRLSLSISKPNVVVETDEDESIFKMSKIDSNTFMVLPFYYRTNRTIDGFKHTFIYDYSRVLTNLKTISHELCFVDGNSYIKLQNGQIAKDSVVLEVYDRGTRELVLTINSDNDALKNDNINASEGLLDISDLLNNGGYSVQDNYFKCSYVYLDIPNLTIKLNKFIADLFNKDIYFSIKPTAILFDRRRYDFPARISYSIFNEVGQLEFTTDTEFALADPKFETMLGYGEEGYGENGYGGIIDPEGEPYYDYQKKKTFGYSEGEYSDGPYGGDIINSVDSMRKLIELKNDSIIGSIVIAKYTTRPSITDIDIFINNYASTPIDIDSKCRTLNLYSGMLIHNSINENYSDIIIAGGIKSIENTAGVYFTGDLVNQNGNQLDLNFDVSSIAELLNGFNEIDDSYILTAAIDSSAKDKSDLFESFQKNHKFDIDDFAIYTYDNNSHELINVDNSVLSDDLTELTVRVTGTYETLGLGFDSGDEKIYPSVYIKL